MNRLASLAALALAAALAHAQPLTTAFTFQGQLNNAGGLASGLYDFRFTLFDAPSGGVQQPPGGNGHGQSLPAPAAPTRRAHLRGSGKARRAALVRSPPLTF